MDTKTYQSVVQDINTALTVADFNTTFTFELLSNQTIDGNTYVNVIKYTGYYLESRSQKLFETIFSTLSKYGEFVTLPRPYQVISGVPSNPVGDHYATAYGYYVHNTDAQITTLKELSIKQDLEGIATVTSSNILNVGTKNSYEVKNITATATIGAIDINNDRSVVITVNATYHQPA